MFSFSLLCLSSSSPLLADALQNPHPYVDLLTLLSASPSGSPSPPHPLLVAPHEDADAIPRIHRDSFLSAFDLVAADDDFHFNGGGVGGDEIGSI